MAFYKNALQFAPLWANEAATSAWVFNDLSGRYATAVYDVVRFVGALHHAMAQGTGIRKPMTPVVIVIVIPVSAMGLVDSVPNQSTCTRAKDSTRRDVISTTTSKQAPESRSSSRAA